MLVIRVRAYVFVCMFVYVRVLAYPREVERLNTAMMFYTRAHMCLCTCLCVCVNAYIPALACVLVRVHMPGREVGSVEDAQVTGVDPEHS